MKNLFIIVILVWLLAGCQRGSVEQFVSQNLPSPSMDMSSLRVQTIHASEEGILVLYSAADTLDPDYRYLGFAVVQEGLAGWKAGMMGSMGGDRTVLNKQTADFTTVDISFDTSMGLHPVFTHQLVYGELIAPDAVTVQAVLDDGTIAQNEVTGKLFAFVTLKPNSICELHILDAQQQLLATITPANSDGKLPGTNCTPDQ